MPVRSATLIQISGTSTPSRSRQATIMVGNLCARSGERKSRSPILPGVALVGPSGDRYATFEACSIGDDGRSQRERSGDANSQATRDLEKHSLSRGGGF